MASTTKAAETMLTQVHYASGQVAAAEDALAHAKARRDELIRQAAAAGIGSRRIAAEAGLAHTGVRKIVLRDQ